MRIQHLPGARRREGTGPTDPLEVAPFDRRVLVPGVVVLLVLMSVSMRFGFHRDELYFLDCARHLQASYVDQPVLTPLLARASLGLFGLSVVGLRLWPALAACATVVVGGLTARELGGGGRAQLVAAVATASMPALLAVDHLADPTAFDLLAWAALALVVVRIGRTGDPRWWPVAGLVLGIGLANKHSVGLFAGALVLATLCAGGRGLVTNRWFAAGAGIAAAFLLPDLWWQAHHQWAAITMTRSLNRHNGGLDHVGTWLGGQLVMTAIPMIGVWAAGLRFLWRSPRPVWRALAWAYGLLFVVFALTTGTKIYYLLGSYVYLLAAGAVALDGQWSLSRRRLGRLLTATMIGTAVALPIALPVLPAADTGWTAAVNQDQVESLGWPQVVGTVATVWRSLPAAQRDHAVIFAANYGEAGAIDELGRGAGLPTAVSGHNTLWWWGPGDPSATTVVAVAPGPKDVTGYDAYLRQFFTGVRQAATLSNPDGVHNQEWGGHVYVCTGLRQPWAEVWSRLRHYD